MKTIIVFVAFAFATLSLSAQTNEPIVQVKFYSDKGATNKITYLVKGPVERLDAMVKGTYPNSDRLFLSVLELDKNEDGYLVHDHNGSVTFVESGKQIILVNYPDTDVLTIGQTIECQARKIGTIRGLKSDGTDSSRVLELWENYVKPGPTSEEIAAAKEAVRIKAERQYQKYLQGQTNAVHWLQSQATNGSASAQCSLGQHYLNGQGCETNQELGIYWLKQAANQGDVEASNKLVLIK